MYVKQHIGYHKYEAPLLLWSRRSLVTKVFKLDFRQKNEYVYVDPLAHENKISAKKWKVSGKERGKTKTSGECEPKDDRCCTYICRPTYLRMDRWNNVILR